MSHFLGFLNSSPLPVGGCKNIENDFFFRISHVKYVDKVHNITQDHQMSIDTQPMSEQNQKFST